MLLDSWAPLRYRRSSMEQDTPLRRLASISGGLRSGPGTTEADLEEVHRLLAPKILRGFRENLTAPGAIVGRVDTPLEELALQESDHLQRVLTAAEKTLVQETLSAESLHLFRRELSLLTPELPTSVPPWAAGWAVERSLGPFLDAFGQPYWFDIRRALQQVVILAPDAQEIVLTMPQGRVDADGNFMLPAGSVWIRAKILAPHAPEHGFVGLKIQEGRLTVNGGGTVTGGGIVLSAGTELTLALTLEPPSPLAALASGPGLDAQDAVVSLPTRATLLIHIPETILVQMPARGGIIASDAAVTVYGVTCNLTFVEGVAATYNSELNRVLIPYRSAATTFAPASVRSQVFQPSGQTAVSRAAWALPVAVPPADAPQLGPVEGVGGLLLVLAPGLQATWSGLHSRVAGGVRTLNLAQTFLLIEPGRLTLKAQQAEAKRVTQTLQLWQESAAPRRCSIDLEFPQPVAVQFASHAATDPSEALLLNSVTAIAHLDQPISADGKRFALLSKQATAILSENSTSRFLRLGGPADLPPNGVEPTALVLTNLFLKTTQPLWLRLFGRLNGPSEIEQGSLHLGFGILAGIPMLPDPYASSWDIPYERLSRLGAGQATTANLAAVVTWTTPTAPSLQLQLLDQADASTLPRQLTTPVPDTPVAGFVRAARGEPAAEVASARERLLSLLETATDSGSEAFRLLDVSTHADQFGVSLASGNRTDQIAAPPANASSRPTIRGLDLVAPANTVRVLTLPAFQWEPIRNIPNPGAGTYPGLVVSDTDGGPTRLGIDTVKLVPVAPLPATADLLTAYNDLQQRPKVMALMTLPFGMIALAALQRNPQALSFRFQPRLLSNQPDFPGAELTGGLQLSLQAPESPLTGKEWPSFPGVTLQTRNYLDPSGATAGSVSALGQNIDLPFNANFGLAGPQQKVPVTRIDLSGYGASLFSDWRDPNVAIAEVGQVRFDALLGRTAYEVIQVNTYIPGCAARVVRIVIIERTGGGGVFRRDSRWIPVSDGLYDYASLKSKVPVPLVTTHPGVVKGFFNIRNIRDTDQMYRRTYPAPTGEVQLAAVLFDADVAIEGVIAGANSEGRVPVRDIVGYVQLAPAGIVLSDAQMDDLLKAKGPMGGAIDCVIDIGGSGLHMRLTQFALERALSASNQPQVVVAARGTVALPRVGQWGLTYRQTGDTEPHGLNPDAAIPLIQENSAVPGVAQPYRFADPAELFHPNAPAAEYGFLQSTDAQRLLIRMPKIEPGQHAITSAQPFLLADAYAMLGGVSLFPRPEACIPLPAGTTLEIKGSGRIRLSIPPQAGLPADSFTVTRPERLLTNQASSLTVRAIYADEKNNPTRITLKIDSDATPDWSISLGPISVLGDLDIFSGLMRIVGKISTESGKRSELHEPRLVFGGPMQPVQEFLNFLREVGLPLGLSFDLTNKTYQVHSTAVLKIPPPIPGPLEDQPDDIDIPGVGKLKGELKLGFGNKSESDAIKKLYAPMSQWRLYFELEGSVQFAPLPPLPAYGGVLLKCKVAGQSDGPTEIQLLAAGIVSIGGDLIALGKLSILEAEVEYSYGYVLLIKGSDIYLGIGIGMKAEVGLLEGLVEVEIATEFMAFPTRINTEVVTVKGQFSVGIELALGWVFNESIEVEGEFEKNVDWRLVAALVLFPVV
jgi:hypothetical protein